MSDTVTKSIYVKADPEKAFNIWADFESFPNFMKYIKSVKRIDDQRARWKMDGPFGITVKWTAEITRFDKDKRIAWSTKDDESGHVTTSGQVTFNEMPQGETEVTVTLKYEPSTSRAGELVAALFSDPESKLEEDLRNFKAYAEGMYDRTGSE